jgi:type IV pilus assembly protein PilY1
MSLNRSIYTYTGATVPSDENLTEAANLMLSSNTAITNDMLGLDASAPAEERDAIIRWARGEDVEDVKPTSDVHQFIADPLHSRPLVITYGGTEANPDDTIFAGTNLGLLHAISSTDGSEQFAFAPRELLPNFATYLQDTAATVNKVYGLDGAITAWRKESDADADATIESGEGDHVYVYVGMRRGGVHYYALDVTNRSTPRLMWQIDGGQGEYRDLGQTWSALKLSKIKWGCSGSGTGCTDKYVLVFAGGYDPVHDSATVPTTGDGGASVYMVDATTGALLWSAGRPATPTALHDLELTDMQNSIPGDVTLADIDSDGYLDMMFAVDITGRVFRFDVNDSPTAAANFATGGVIADLGDWDSVTTNDQANFRRFYYAPDVAYFAPRGQRAFLAISAASGYRAHPRDTVVDDKVYSIFDPNVLSPPKDGSGAVNYASLDASDTGPLDERDLFDATSAVANKFTNAPHGWFKRLQGTDEKGLSSPTTFAGALVFTTYLPTNGSSTVVCGADIGTGRVYVLDALTGQGLIRNGTVFDEYLTLAHSGIPPAPSIVYTDDSVTWTDGNGDTQTNQQTQPIVCVGTECFDDLLPTDDPLLRTFWREN